MNSLSASASEREEPARWYSLQRAHASHPKISIARTAILQVDPRALLGIRCRSPRYQLNSLSRSHLHRSTNRLQLSDVLTAGSESTRSKKTKLPSERVILQILSTSPSPTSWTAFISASPSLDTTLHSHVNLRRSTHERSAEWMILKHVISVWLWHPGTDKTHFSPCSPIHVHRLPRGDRRHTSSFCRFGVAAFASFKHV